MGASGVVAGSDVVGCGVVAGSDVVGPDVVGWCVVICFV